MKKTLINTALLITSVLLCFQLFRLWSSPIELPKIVPEAKKNPLIYKISSVRPILFYRAVSENNLFSPARRGTAGYSMVKRNGPAPVQRPPSMSLIGTVLIGKGRIAIVDTKKPNHRPGSYKIDENIDGYILKSIGKDKIILEKNGATFEITLLKKGARRAGSVRRTYPLSYSKNIKRPVSTNRNTGMVEAVPLPPPTPPGPRHHIGLNTVKK